MYVYIYDRQQMRQRRRRRHFNTHKQNLNFSGENKSSLRTHTHTLQNFISLSCHVKFCGKFNRKFSITFKMTLLRADTFRLFVLHNNVTKVFFCRNQKKTENCVIYLAFVCDKKKTPSTRKLHKHHLSV